MNEVWKDFTSFLKFLSDQDILHHISYEGGRGGDRLSEKKINKLEVWQDQKQDQSSKGFLVIQKDLLTVECS